MKTALKLAFILALLTGGYLILDSMIVQAGSFSELNKSLHAANKFIDNVEHTQKTTIPIPNKLN